MATVPSGFFVTANAGEALVIANTPAVASPAIPSADPVSSAGRRKRGAPRVAGLVAVTDDASAAVAPEAARICSPRSRTSCDQS